MGYASCVAAVVGGSAKEVNALAAKLKQLKLSEFEANLLNEFQILNISDEFTIFVFFAQWYKWYEEDEALWHKICEMAQKNHLSWHFRRLGEEYGDFEENSGGTDNDRIDQLSQLFSLRYEIEPYHEKLIGQFELT